MGAASWVTNQGVAKAESKVIAELAKCRTANRPPSKIWIARARAVRDAKGGARVSAGKAATAAKAAARSAKDAMGHATTAAKAAEKADGKPMSSPRRRATTSNKGKAKRSPRRPLGIYRGHLGKGVGPLKTRLPKRKDRDGDSVVREHRPRAGESYRKSPHPPVPGGQATRALARRMASNTNGKSKKMRSKTPKPRTMMGGASARVTRR